MFRIPARAALAALALCTAAATPAAAASYEVTTVAYSSDAVAYISAVYTPVDVVIGPKTAAVTKADCFTDYTGTGDDESAIVLATFVAKVVTDDVPEINPGRPQDSVPAATGITCTLTNQNGELIKEWSSVRPGVASYDVYTEQVEKYQSPRICVTAWVLYGDGRRVNLPATCRDA